MLPEFKTSVTEEEACLYFLIATKRNNVSDIDKAA
jgi:hypothetical protein